LLHRHVRFGSAAPVRAATCSRLVGLGYRFPSRAFEQQLWTSRPQHARAARWLLSAANRSLDRKRATDAFGSRLCGKSDVAQFRGSFNPCRCCDRRSWADLRGQRFARCASRGLFTQPRSAAPVRACWKRPLGGQRCGKLCSEHRRRVPNVKLQGRSVSRRTET
jgi:hypothetical protein